MRQSYERRMAAGLCASCGRPKEDAGRALCEACRERGNARHRELRLLRKAEGLCAVCGRRPAEPGKTRCGECARRQRDYWNHGGACGGDCESCPFPDCVSPGPRGALYRGRRRAAGLCLTCGKRPPAPGAACCAECARRQSEYARERTRIRAEAGLCTRCGKRPASPGMRSCRECRAKDKARKAGGPPGRSRA